MQLETKARHKREHIRRKLEFVNSGVACAWHGSTLEFQLSTGWNLLAVRSGQLGFLEPIAGRLDSYAQLILSLLQWARSR